MWTLQTAGGDRINVFNNMLERPPWDNSGYRAWFEAMESGQYLKVIAEMAVFLIALFGQYPMVVGPVHQIAQPRGDFLAAFQLHSRVEIISRAVLRHVRRDPFEITHHSVCAIAHVS